MLKALREWNQPVIKYAPSAGDPNFINAMVWYYHKIGFQFVEKTDITIGVGCSEILQWIFFAICEKGDEVLTFEPFYSNYSAIAAITDTKVTAVETTLEDGFHLPTRKEIEAKITPRTRAIMVCNPANPTGTVYRKEEIQLLVDICRDKNIFLIADEPYREYVFEGTQTSLLEYMQQLPNQIILLDSLSKRYSLCGARLGILVTKNVPLRTQIQKMAMARLSGGFIDQIVGAKLTEVPDTYLSEVNEEYRHRRDILYAGLTAIPGVTMPVPEGAFYSMVSLPVEDAEEFAIWMLEKYPETTQDKSTVMLAPGQGFYATPGKGKQQVRIAYVLNVDNLKKCIDMIRDGLEKFKATKNTQ